MRPARLPPPSQGRRPGRCRGASAPRTHGEGDPQPTHGPNRGWGDEPLKTPPASRARETGPGHGHRPPDQLGPYATGLPTPGATQPNRRGAEDASRQRGHDAGGPEAGEEMTENSDPQKSGGSPPTTASCSMPQQREPSTGNVPEGHLGTTSGHPPPAGSTPDKDRETMPPQPPRPPRRRNTDHFDAAELGPVYDIHANTPSSGLVAALWEHLQDVDPNTFDFTGQKVAKTMNVPPTRSIDLALRVLSTSLSAVCIFCVFVLLLHCYCM